MITCTLVDFLFAKPEYKLHELAIFMGSDVGRKDDKNSFEISQF